MFDDELDEGMRLTWQLMEKALQRELYDARDLLAKLRAHRNQLEEDISYTLEQINEIKRTAHETGATVK